MSKKSKSLIDQDHLWLFQHKVFFYIDFVMLFEQIKDVMSLLSVNENAFFEDILWIEISELKQSQLIIVDLSDLIHSHNKHQIKHDVNLVTSLIVKYMINSRSIILAVIFAKNDFSNQIVQFLILSFWLYLTWFAF